MQLNESIFNASAHLIRTKLVWLCVFVCCIVYIVPWIFNWMRYFSSFNSICNWYILNAWHSHSIHLKLKRFQWKAKRQKNPLFWNWIAHTHALVYSLCCCVLAALCLQCCDFSGKNKWSHLKHCTFEWIHAKIELFLVI